MASSQYVPPASPSVQTPTTKSIPMKNIMTWDTEDVGDFIEELGFGQHRDLFMENEIIGEALIHLAQDDLAELGVTSIGHQLSILKAVYNIKIAQDVPIEPEHYVPISAGMYNENADTMYVTVADFQKLIEAVKYRDDRVYQAEGELRKVTDAFYKLREEMLPILKTIKNETKPLPHPSTITTTTNSTAPQDLGSSNRERDMRESTTRNRDYTDRNRENSEAVMINREPTPQPVIPQPAPSNLSRKFSTKKLFLGGNNSNLTKPTLSPTSLSGSTIRESLRDPSIDSIASTSSGQGTTVYAPSNLRDYGPSSSRSDREPGPPLQTPSSPSAGLSRSYSQSQNSRYTRDRADMEHYRERESTTRAAERNAPPLASPQGPVPSNSQSDDPPTVEIFKSFRVSMDDPCYKVLPAALKRYNIQADWQHYALYIVYGDQERCLALDEKPLILFKQLDKEGKKPTFMLRRHLTPETGQPGGAVNGGAPMSGQYQQPVLPGGVL